MNDLTAHCGACGSRVTPGSGWLWVDMPAAAEADELAHWRITHEGCLAEPLTAAAYAIDIEQVLSARRLLWWTAHLSEKTWLDGTDWAGLIRQAGNTGHLEEQARA